MRLPLLVWAVSRSALLLCVLGVLTLRGPDVTTDVSVIYQGWADVLRGGTFPVDDVTWQYPPGAALPVLSPLLLPFLTYPVAFFAFACLADAVVLALLLAAARRPAGGRAGAWLWIAGMPLLGPTVYARYDVMVTAVAVAALLAAARHPRLAGALVAFGALLKVWPALLLVGTAPGRQTRAVWGAAAGTAAVLAGLAAVVLPGGWAFLGAQRERGIEVESVGALVFHVSRHFGWPGEVRFNYGSMEFLGPHVQTVATASLLCTVAAFGWLLWWRLRAEHRTPSALADAAFAAVLLFTVTSRVISPQYLVWLVGLAAVCLALRSRGQLVPAWLVLAATGVTLLEFPVFFDAVVSSEPLGLLLLFARNGLLVAAALLSCAGLWRTTAAAPHGAARPEGAPDGHPEPGPGPGAGLRAGSPR
ncbi:glycosyltransferase 87 family protein [Streptomyces sp. TRM 70351]|uniref:glycosyltransferase 87 family protein n=1 Tax=Streptomyces sp. TRM 70351 TaxID=3116552 RepID=UPI002E7C174D|nr:glycosyltransferase 87 family protein [Streptomyces sp. TRM 70351]MEE1928695.1 glycosyltransferase 87 family protein [Streptomyces sp. TRM 70351]